MGQSLSQMYIHLVFGTKLRYPYINENVSDSLHAYIAGILKNLESPALKINSVPDHIHILFRLSKNYSLAKVVEEVKKQSSKWMKEQGVTGFTWQGGYGAFSISSYKVEIVKNYIIRQQEHHKIVSYKDEVEKFIKDYKLNNYDTKYFWR